MTQTHAGACHCGAVTYEAAVALDPVIACNCTHCYAKGLQLVFTTPDRFRLMSGGERLKSYRFNRGVIEHLFCDACGVQPFARGKAPDGSDSIAVNIRTLRDVEPDTVVTTGFDGRNKL